MRIDILLTSSLLLLIVVSSRGQDPVEPARERRVGYHNQFSTGILAGGDRGMITGSVTTVHGVAMRRWTIGMGIGMEGYERWRTIPVFGSMSYYFRGPTSNGVFVGFNAGHSFGKLLMDDERIHVTDTQGGPMVNPMIGYHISANSVGLSVAAGYKMQRMTGRYSDSFSGVLTYTFEERLDRFFFQLGISIP